MSPPPAFKIVLAPVRAVVAAVGEIGSIIGNALGIESTNVLFNLEQGWIGIKEAITDASDRAIFIGQVIGGVIGNAALAVSEFVNGVRQKIGGLAQRIADFFRQAFEKILSFIPEPIKRLLGGLELPPIDLKIKGIKDFGKDFLKGAKEKAEELKNTVIEFSGVERKITEENNKQIDAKNKIVATNGKIKTSVDAVTNAEKNATDQADKLKDKFMKIGEDIERGIVTNLTDAVMGTKSLADAATSVLNNLKRQLIELAIQKAVSGIGGKIGGFLGGLFGGKKERGGRVSAGGAFVVGERGPEILQMGSKGGNIIPNSAIGKGGGETNNIVTVNVDASGSSVSGNTADANQLGQVIGQAVQAQLIKEKRAGGLLTR